jgi:type VI secretion system secreted protein Hcp
MAFRAFMKIDGLNGESTDPDHPHWCDILSFTHDIGDVKSADVADRIVGRRVSTHPFTVEKASDCASPTIYRSCYADQRIASVHVELCDGDRFRFLEIRLEDVYVSGVRLVARSESPALHPVEVIHFTFDKIIWTYTIPDDPSGAVGGNVTAGWSTTTQSAQ